MRVAIIFDNFGPYHRARLEAAAQVSQLLAVEMRARSNEYAWVRDSGPNGFESVKVESAGQGWGALGLSAILTRFGPQCVFIPGWARWYCWSALIWCRAHRVPAVLMSESTRGDKPRRRWTERVKRRIVSRFSAALVGGSAHRSYLEELGMAAKRIYEGYDAVDNDYFRNAALGLRANPRPGNGTFGGRPASFLACSRFIARKNLGGLLQAYARYRGKTKLRRPRDGGELVEPWNLVILGDGPLRPELERQIVDLGLQPFVRVPGFVQYRELPSYYGSAEVFIHASFAEPWGLVVNEAMASGLPVIVSDRCGCAPDLVQKANGFVFNPADTETLSALMLRLAQDHELRRAMGQASLAIIASRGPQHFAAGFVAATQAATQLATPTPDLQPKLCGN